MEDDIVDRRTMLGRVRVSKLLETAHGVKRAGAPQTCCGEALQTAHVAYEFQGLGIEALRFCGKRAEQTGLPVVNRSHEHRRRGRDLRVCRYASGGSP